jgi:hypothetical protein
VGGGPIDIGTDGTCKTHWELKNTNNILFGI